MSKKAIVIGIDGANWDLIDPWIQNGDLPNLAKLKNGGSWAYNNSYLPPVTFPNWKCYSTGKNPGKLGVYWFEKIDFTSNKITIPDGNSFKGKEIWDYLSDMGMKVCVINMPSTFPPKRIENGIVISGGPDSSDTNFTSPENLERTLKTKFNYRVHPRILPINKDDRGECVSEILEVINSRFEVTNWLIENENFDFVHLSIFYINVLQHFYSDGEPAKKGWKLIDKHLKYFIDNGFDIFLMSDHGTCHIDHIFWINKWLEDEGYLKIRKSNSAKIYQTLGKYRDQILKVSRKLRVEPILRKIIPKSLKHRIQPGGAFQQTGKNELIDWENSIAIASGQGPIYIKKLQDKNEYEKIRLELKSKIEQIQMPNEKFKLKVYKKEDIYSGPYLDSAPDLIIEQPDGIHINGGVGSRTLFQRPTRWLAENSKKGIFLFYSPLSTTGKINDINIVDIAPTLLHFLNVPIPEDMDGRAIIDIFRQNSDEFKREVVYQKAILDEEIQQNKEDREKEIINRLKDLGYLEQ